MNVSHALSRYPQSAICFLERRRGAAAAGRELLLRGCLGFELTTQQNILAPANFFDPLLLLVVAATNKIMTALFLR